MGNGTYLVRAHARVNGERIERERKVEASSIQEAASKKRALELEMAAGASGAETAPRTLGDVARAWLERKTEARRKDGSKRLAPSTAARYRHSVNEMIVAYVGQLDVARVKRADIEEWRDHLGEHYAATTVNGALVVLRMIFRDIDKPIANEVSPIVADDTRITDDEPNALDEEEVGRFVDALRATNPQHYALVLVMLSSGQRISTVLALRWEDVDRQRETITFRRRLSEGQVLPGVKRSRTAKDEAPLHPVVWAELEAHRAQLGPAELASGLVFPSADGGHHARTVLKRPFKRALKLAGIAKRFTPHGCRRTASALLRRVGGSVVTKAIVGHTTDAMHEHYAVVGMDEKARASREAFRVLEGGRSGEPGKSGDRGGDPKDDGRGGLAKSS